MNDDEIREKLEEAIVQLRAINGVFDRVLDPRPAPPLAERNSRDTVARMLRLPT